MSPNALEGMENARSSAVICGGFCRFPTFAKETVGKDVMFGVRMRSLFSPPTLIVTPHCGKAGMCNKSPPHYSVQVGTLSLCWRERGFSFLLPPSGSSVCCLFPPLTLQHKQANKQKECSGFPSCWALIEIILHSEFSGVLSSL